jgi:hypothetical protein
MATPRVTTPGPEAGALVPGLPADVRAALAEIGGDQFAAAMAAHVWPLALDLLSDFASRPAPEQKRAWLERAGELFELARLSLQRNRRDSATRRQMALKYVAGLPDDVRSLIALPVGPGKAAVYAAESPPDWLTMDDKARERAAFLAYVDLAEVMREQQGRFNRDEAKQRVDAIRDRAAMLGSADAAVWIAAIARALRHPGVSRPERKGPKSEAVEVAASALAVYAAYKIKLSASSDSPAVRALQLLGNAACQSCELKPLSRFSWRRALSAARTRAAPAA